MPRPSGTCAIPSDTMRCAGVLEMSWPLKQISPPRFLMSPEITRRVVDFPAPFAPISVTISPSSTWRSMPLRAFMPPYPALSPLTLRSDIARAGDRPRPQIGFDHDTVALDFRGRALADLAAVVQHGEPLADAHDDPHLVL